MKSRIVLPENIFSPLNNKNKNRETKIQQTIDFVLNKTKQGWSVDAIILEKWGVSPEVNETKYYKKKSIVQSIIDKQQQLNNEVKK